MIANILEMLEIAKHEKEIGEYTHIALGKNKIPLTISDAYKQKKREQWQRK